MPGGCRKWGVNVGTKSGMGQCGQRMWDVTVWCDKLQFQVSWVHKVGWNWVRT